MYMGIYMSIYMHCVCRSGTLFATKHKRPRLHSNSGTVSMDTIVPLRRSKREKRLLFSNLNQQEIYHHLTDTPSYSVVEFSDVSSDCGFANDVYCTCTLYIHVYVQCMYMCAVKPINKLINGTNLAVPNDKRDMRVYIYTCILAVSYDDICLDGLSQVRIPQDIFGCPK